MPCTQHLIHPPQHHCRQPRTITLSQQTHKQQYTHHSQSNHRIHTGYHDKLTDDNMTTDTTQGHRPSSKSDRNLVRLQVNINVIKNSRSSNCLITTHMQISSQFRKPISPLKQTHPKYITSLPCVTICCTRHEVGSLHLLETTLHSLQQTYLRPSIPTTQNFKWSRYTLTTPNISQLQTFIYFVETAHPRTKTADMDIQHCIQYITNIT